MEESKKCGPECEVCAAEPEHAEVIRAINEACKIDIWFAEACVDVGTYFPRDESKEDEQRRLDGISKALGVPVGLCDRLVDVALRMRVARAS